MRTVYGVLGAFGLVLPYSQLVPWLTENGLAVRLLVQEVAASRSGAFAWLDVLISAVALIVFILVEGRRLNMRYLWLPVVATFTVGVALGLPLFLWQREGYLRRGAV